MGHNPKTATWKITEGKWNVVGCITGSNFWPQT